MFCHLNITPDRKKSPYHNIYGCFGVYDTTSDFSDGEESIKFWMYQILMLLYW